MVLSGKSRNTFNASILVIIGMALAPLLWVVLPFAETRFFPVVINTAIIRAVETKSPWTEFYGESTRIRDCTFDHIEWFYSVTGSASVRVPLNILERPKIRPGGQFEFGPWELPLSEDQLRKQSFALVYHRCPFIPWITGSIFYP